MSLMFPIYIYQFTNIVVKGLSPFSVLCLLHISVHYVPLICILQCELN